MHAHRVDIFHVADRDHVARAVAHDLVLDLLPARDAALHQHLSHPGEAQAVLQNLGALLGILGDAATGAAQGVSRAQNHRITDLLRNLKAASHVLHNIRGGYRLADLLHGLLEHFPVLGLLDGQGRGSDQAHAVLFQKARILQLHGQVQPGLSAQGGQHAVRLLLQNQLLHHLHGQRLNVHPVRNILVRHNSGGVGV